MRSANGWRCQSDKTNLNRGLIKHKLALSQRLGASLIYSNIFRLLDVALLKAVALLLVYNLQEDRDDDCNSAEESED